MFVLIQQHLTTTPRYYEHGRTGRGTPPFIYAAWVYLIFPKLEYFSIVKLFVNYLDMSDLELRNIYRNMFKENEPHRYITLCGMLMRLPVRYFRDRHPVTFERLDLD